MEWMLGLAQKLQRDPCILKKAKQVEGLGNELLSIMYITAVYVQARR